VTQQLALTQPPPPDNYFNFFKTPPAAPEPAAPQTLGPPHTIFHHAKPISPRVAAAKPSAAAPPKPSPVQSHGSASGSAGQTSSSAADRTHDRLARIHGPTSIPFLIHSSASIPPSTFSQYDLKHHTTWEISAGGDGIVKVLAPPCPPLGDGGPGEEVGAEMLERLVNHFFEDISPIFPVVTRHEFLSLENPSPLLLYSICAVASTRRSIPRGVFSSLRTIINGIIRSNDVLSDTSLVNVQSLLILALVGDLHVSVGAGGAVGAASVRLGVAIRMVRRPSSQPAYRLDPRRTDHLFWLALAGAGPRPAPRRDQVDHRDVGARSARGACLSRAQAPRLGRLCHHGPLVRGQSRHADADRSARL